MLSYFFTNPLATIVSLLGLVVAITIHEFAHAWTADKLGDPTPRYQGRVTLDPRAHLDPLGTLAIILTRFGWGKPVQFDPYNLKDPLRDTALIALAGPIANLAMATIFSIFLHFLPLPLFISFAFAQLIFINLMLAIFNLIPVYPLDGGKIIVLLLPKEAALEYEQIMRHYGTFILLMLILPIYNGSSAAGLFISPIIQLLSKLLLF